MRHKYRNSMRVWFNVSNSVSFAQFDLDTLVIKLLLN